MKEFHILLSRLELFQKHEVQRIINILTLPLILRILHLASSLNQPMILCFRIGLWIIKLKTQWSSSTLMLLARNVRGAQSELNRNIFYFIQEFIKLLV